MNALKLNQLNKVKMAEREMKDIEGGAAEVCYSWTLSRAQLEWNSAVNVCTTYCDDSNSTQRDRPSGTAMWLD